MKPDLPILEFEEKILATVNENPVVVIIGETGSGKSTQLSQILLRNGYTNSGIIAVTQPRRVAAVSVSSLSFSVLTGGKFVPVIIWENREPAMGEWREPGRLSFVVILDK
ncbi:probable pre-mRNA-splicing factor ATP-dependent RNA helicase DEAH4 isoform X1 [Tanacetum coccineum]